MIKLVTEPFPLLSTPRLFLRKIEYDDKDAIFKLRSDAEVNKYLGRKPAASVNDAFDFIAKTLKAIDNNESFYWAVCILNSKNIIGTICLWNINIDESKAEVGYELLPQYQGQGFMSEALAAVVEYGLKIGFNVFEAVLEQENKSSVKLLERHNFILQPGKTADGLVVYKLNSDRRG